MIMIMAITMATAAYADGLDGGGVTGTVVVVWIVVVGTVVVLTAGMGDSTANTGSAIEKAKLTEHAAASTVNGVIASHVPFIRYTNGAMLLDGALQL